ncbi:hypothetical protein OS493_028873 [Desmophyllum pertusum]|uniref:Uncharacterized protein n=1 Tax=Desmophyllum pertusum TaxID=174260 RepID=A0A9W9ZKI4_9CNID|nr:hypothetical protein OS493_028873 [Desmophyllum pertusum]
MRLEHQESRGAVGAEVCDQILLIHAITGYDTTCRLHGIGKGATLKKFVNSLYFREQAKVLNMSSTVDEIGAAVENALVSLYNGKPGDRLDALRCQKYCEKVASNRTQIQPQSLPLTSTAAIYHSLWANLQV